MKDDKRRTPSDGKSSHCLWQGELKRILKCEYLHVMHNINMLTIYQQLLISKGDNGKSYFSFNSLMARVISLLTVYYNREVFLEMNQSKTRIACGGHVY